jgi:uncharacterized protein (TIGR03435 family)
MKSTLLLLVSCVAFAQTPAFEVADVHVSKSGARPQGGILPGGRVELHGFTLLNLIAFAYGIDDDMVVGGPKWLDTDRFDVNAKGPKNLTDEAAKPLLQALLADRFKLTLHSEPKPAPAFALTVGKKLLIKEAAGSDDGGCEPKVDMPWISFVCKNLTMAQFAERVHQWAGGYLDHPVVDQTGLKGGYDFTIRWTNRGQLANTPDGLSIFDAVDKELGLKLEAKKLPVPAIVIDSVNQTPTPNAPGVKENLPVSATEFEVADVKMSRPDEKMNGRILPSGRVDLEAFPLRDAIKFAYDIQDDSGLVAPKWLETAKFDIHANAGSAVSMEALRTMMKSLLADRFKLTVHKEDQPVPVYVLVAGKKPKLEPSTGADRAGCKRSVPNNMMLYECKSTTMAQFAEGIHQIAGGYLGDHPMIDGTELTGTYDFSLTWTPVQALKGPGRGGAAPADAGVASDPGGLTVFEAIERQLGLKVETQKRPMPVVVIDHINQTPTEN